MRSTRRLRSSAVPVLASAAALLVSTPASAAAPAAGGAGLGAHVVAGSGGASLGGLDPRPGDRRRPAVTHRLLHGTWFHGVTITEYWPAPESWFVGRLVGAPGLTGKHRIDWLYSASGVSMEGEGLGLDGRTYHIDALGRGGWVTSAGRSTSSAHGWPIGAPYWRAGGYWRNRAGALTFPLQDGGWSSGRGHGYVPLPGISFAPGASAPLRFYRSIAVDPKVIPLGSHVYIPAYAGDGHGGWFTAQDTGGAIAGRHVDVYRSPPASASDAGHYLAGQTMYVMPPRG